MKFMLLFNSNTFIFSISKNFKINLYKRVNLPVVLLGCEVWSLILREECRLRVFENSILRRIFGSKSDGNGRGVEKAPQ